MSDFVQPCAALAPPIDPDAHRRIRLRHLGLQGPTAQLVSELAFGPPRDAVAVVAVVEMDALVEGGRR